MSEKKKYRNIGLGTILQSKDPNPDGSPRFYLRLEQQTDKDGNPYGPKIFPITLADGTVIEEGDSATMFSKQAKFKKLVADGKMSAEKAEELKFLRYDVVLGIPEDRPNGKGSKSDGVDF